MKFTPRTVAATSFVGFLVAASTVSAADANKPLVAHARTVTPPPTARPTVEPPVPPVSKFEIPRRVTEGRDPFFPNSTRVYALGTANTPTNRPTAVIADLVLKGISGTAEQPLAIINTTTFATGETNEVILKNGRIRIQCLEINMSLGTVLLQIGSERRELRLSAK